MTDEEQDFGAWRTEQQRRAQAHAFDWAERATREYGVAVRNEDDARERQQYDSGWQRDRAAESRSLAQVHGTRSVEAVKLAEMWAHVAQALATGELPALAFAAGGTLDTTAIETMAAEMRDRGHPA